MKIMVEWPDTPLIAGLDPTYLKDALVATLYHVGKLSEKEACLILGVSRRTFEALLPRFGFAMLADDPDTVATELQACRKKPLSSTLASNVRVGHAGFLF